MSDKYMEVDRTLLQTMFREFWALNNELCENATIIFLRQHDFTDKEISEWLDIRYEDIKNRNLKEAQEVFDEKFKKQKTISYIKIINKQSNYKYE